ncbi:MAG: NAD(P)/FAD-dependent oxidoreductase [Bacteroidetes bacterium]|nr:NAD(P)/FAD-dependent oxidoreductase [Bacteroidota bacterium]
MKRKAIIIGAGPAGLTAAYELITRTDIIPIVLEKSPGIGGICKTVNHKGNRIDIGGHRFFSKSERVMQWWLNILPLESSKENINLKYQNKSYTINPTAHPQSNDPNNDKVMLVRKRVSHILYLKKFFNYPLSFSIDTMRKLGLSKLTRIIITYMISKVRPRKENNLEDFFINRFGKELYYTFFKDYTEKVWGKPCTEISAEWGAQRIKKLSVGKAILHFVKNKFKANDSIAQKSSETSLIEYFLYPKYGPGQLWEEVATRIREKGGEIFTGYDVSNISFEGELITRVEATDQHHSKKIFDGDYFFSSMPVKELLAIMQPGVDKDLLKISNGLAYRNFITVGVLLKKISANTMTNPENGFIPDNWIYVQDHSVKLGRIQIYNNWSPALVKDPGTVWLGLEYFADDTDALWNMNDSDFINFAIKELESIGFANASDVLDTTVIRMEKAYPGYFGTYPQFNIIKDFTDQFTNLYLVGRNGMHKYNNSDHSMLTAMTAVDNIINGITSKENIWSINTEQDYQE